MPVPTTTIVGRRDFVILFSPYLQTRQERAALAIFLIRKKKQRTQRA